MASVQFARSAQTDLLEAWLFIAEEDQSAADRVLDTIEHEANILVTQPLMGSCTSRAGTGYSQLANVYTLHSVLHCHDRRHHRDSRPAPCA